MLTLLLNSMHIFLFLPAESPLFPTKLKEDFLTLLKGWVSEQQRQIEFHEMQLPATHREIIPLLEKQKEGILLLPALWEDLYSVKLLNEAENLSGEYSSLFYGSIPESEQLITAFNAGIQAYIPLPIPEKQLAFSLNRAVRKHEKNLQKRQKEGRFNLLSYEKQQREHKLLGKAFKDLLHSRNPFILDHVHLLIVNSSSAQEKRLSRFLTEIGSSFVSVRSIAEAIDAFKEDTQFHVLITDYLLPDGDALKLVKTLKEKLQHEMPRVLVWSSTPEEIPKLLRPETFIDEVIIKPSPDEGIESLLPALLFLLYQKKN